MEENNNLTPTYLNPFYFNVMENNNFERTYHYKEFRLDENLTLFTVDVNNRESIELLIVRLIELEDRIGEINSVDNR